MEQGRVGRWWQGDEKEKYSLGENKIAIIVIAITITIFTKKKLKKKKKTS
jgi:hypothetical protein